MTPDEEYRSAANKLHHLSMRYVAAFAEIGTGKPVSFMTKNYPGLREVRDLIDLLLFVRAEMNGLTNLLHKKGLIDAKEMTPEFAEQCAWLMTEKARFLQVEVNDAGLVIKPRTPESQ